MLGLDCTWDGSSTLSALAVDVKVHIHFQRMAAAARYRMQDVSVPPGLDLGCINP